MNTPKTTFVGLALIAAQCAGLTCTSYVPRWTKV